MAGRDYRFDARAEFELDEAVLWYEHEQEGLGFRLLDVAHAMALHAVQFPETGSLVPDVPAQLGARRYSLKPFPYWLVTIPAHGTLVVIAIASQHREPGYWHERVNKAPR